MDNSKNEEVLFEEAVKAISKKDDNGNIDPPEQKPQKNNTFDMIL